MSQTACIRTIEQSHGSHSSKNKRSSMMSTMESLRTSQPKNLIVTRVKKKRSRIPFDEEKENFTLPVQSNERERCRRYLKFKSNDAHVVIQSQSGGKVHEFVMWASGGSNGSLRCESGQIGPAGERTKSSANVLVTHGDGRIARGWQLSVSHPSQAGE